MQPTYYAAAAACGAAARQAAFAHLYMDGAAGWARREGVRGSRQRALSRYAKLAAESWPLERLPSAHFTHPPLPLSPPHTHIHMQVVAAMRTTITNILGTLPPQFFRVSISSSGENLAQLMYSVRLRLGGVGVGSWQCGDGAGVCLAACEMGRL